MQSSTIAQEKYKIITIGFYNLENLFDTQDDPSINDEEFLPEGTRAWTTDKYEEKLANMAYVISQIGIEENPSGLSILGVSEIENKRVLEDLTHQAILKERNYQIVHFDSPDLRGVDVGLIYNPLHFEPISSVAIPLELMDNGKRRYTRDILYVKGKLDSDTIHVLVNHWPSRGGGESRTKPSRNKAAKICRHIVDSLQLKSRHEKIIIMGDLNDDPTSESVKSFLRAVENIKDVSKTGLFNPFADLYRRGQGSNAYRDNWSLFDQIILSTGICIDNKGYRFLKGHVYNKKYLIQPSGQYKGYPYRTFSGDNYQGGYSDHFPTYVFLIKPINI